MEQIFRWCMDHLPAIALAIPTVIQIAPIKIDPWTWMFKWIGKILTSDVSKEIKQVRKEFSDEIADLKNLHAEQQEAIDNNEIDRIRYEVLDFANSCRNGRKHTKDEFEHIIVLNKKYQRLLTKTGAENGVFDAEYEYIYDIYKRCQRENTFL